MMTISGRRSFIAAMAALAWAGWGQAAEVSVSDAWARATMPGQKVAGVYMTITSVAPARLVAVETPAARVAEIHEMRNDGGVMKMRRMDGLTLPAGEPVALAPGGFHIMLMDIKQPLAVGQEIALTLVVEAGGTRQSIPVKAPVKAVGAAAGHEHH